MILKGDMYFFKQQETYKRKVFYLVILSPKEMIPTSLFSSQLIIHNFFKFKKNCHWEISLLFAHLKKMSCHYKKLCIHLYVLYLFSNLKLDKEIHSRVCRLIFQGGCQCEDEFAKGCEIWDHEVHFRL